jgi:hypothetical protein
VTFIMKRSGCDAFERELRSKLDVALRKRAVTNRQ